MMEIISSEPSKTYKLSVTNPMLYRLCSWDFHQTWEAWGCLYICVLIHALTVELQRQLFFIISFLDCWLGSLWLNNKYSFFSHSLIPYTFSFMYSLIHSFLFLDTTLPFFLCNKLSYGVSNWCQYSAVSLVLTNPKPCPIIDATVIHQLIHQSISFIYWLIDWLIHPFIHSFIHSDDSFVNSYIHSFLYPYCAFLSLQQLSYSASNWC